MLLRINLNLNSFLDMVFPRHEEVLCSALVTRAEVDGNFNANADPVQR